jgi:aminoglycoside phosphotransferase (APT) family kinase protein
MKEMSVLANAPSGVAWRPFHRNKENALLGVESSKPDDVGVILLQYLRKKFRSAYLQFSEFPHSLDNGWETHTYLFALESSPLLPREFTGPLVLRIYSSPEGLPRARHETAVQNHLKDVGYPVCPILILEEDCSIFEGPFLIMERALGKTLVEFLSLHPLWIWPIAHQMAIAHHQLHELPTNGFPGRHDSFLNRRLGEIEELIKRFELAELIPGLDWLKVNRPPEPEKTSILHLDFHPFNLIRSPDGRLTVLDWPEADVGDYHADLGTTALLFDCVPVAENSLFDEMILPIGRTLLEVGYLYEYKRRMAVDDQKLAYYKALATLRRLAGYGRWLRASPLATGCKPSSIRYLCPHHLKIVENYFRKVSGVSVQLAPRKGA